MCDFCDTLCGKEHAPNAFSDWFIFHTDNEHDTVFNEKLHFIQIMNRILTSTKRFTFLLFWALFKQDLSDLAYDEVC